MARVKVDLEVPRAAPRIKGTCAWLYPKRAELTIHAHVTRDTVVVRGYVIVRGTKTRSGNGLGEWNRRYAYFEMSDINAYQDHPVGAEWLKIPDHIYSAAVNCAIKLARLERN